MQTVYQERRQKLISALSLKGVSCAIITDTSDIIYFTGISYHPMERLLALVLDIVWEKAVLVVPSPEKGKQPHAMGLEEIAYLDNQDSMEVLATLVNKVGFIGIQKSSLSLLRAEQLAQKTKKPISLFVDISFQILHFRMYKDLVEVENLRKACAITCQVLNEWKNYVKPGINERELRLQLDFLNAKYGANESCPGILIASGIHSSAAHSLGYGRNVEKDEPLFIDCGVRWNYYYCDITRTFFTGRPNSLLENVYRIVHEAQLAALDTVKPGVPLKEIDAAARNIIIKAGFGAYFTHRTGHGLGIDVHELPDVGQDSVMVAQEGMVFTIEPGIYLPEIGGVRIEDDVLVTESGKEILTTYPKSIEDMIL